MNIYSPQDEHIVISNPGRGHGGQCSSVVVNTCQGLDGAVDA